MFQQKINLFRAFEEPEPPASILSWHKMMLGNVIFIIFLLIVVAYNYAEVYYLTKKMEHLQAQVSIVESQFYEAKKKYPPVFFSRDVEQSIGKLTSEMKMREKLLKKVANHALFSSDMEAFSRIIIPDVWLTGFSISNSGDEITLKGKSISADSMQVFLTRLTTDQAFANRSLSVKNIQDDTKTKATGDLIFDITMIKNDS